MNCREGDLAIVNSGGANGGKIVRCIKLVSRESLPLLIKHARAPNIWEVDIDIRWIDSKTKSTIGYFPFADDRKLIPIRPDCIESTEEVSVKEVSS